MASINAMVCASRKRRPWRGGISLSSRYGMSIHAIYSDRRKTRSRSSPGWDGGCGLGHIYNVRCRQRSELSKCLAATVRQVSCRSLRRMVKRTLAKYSSKFSTKHYRCGWEWNRPCASFAKSAENRSSLNTTAICTACDHFVRPTHLLGNIEHADLNSLVDLPAHRIWASKGHVVAEILYIL